MKLRHKKRGLVALMRRKAWPWFVQARPRGRARFVTWAAPRRYVVPFGGLSTKRRETLPTCQTEPDFYDDHCWLKGLRMPWGTVW